MRNGAFAAILAAVMVSFPAPVFAAPAPGERYEVSGPSAAPDTKRPLGYLAELTDIEAYKFLVLASRAPQRGSADYKPEPWREIALGYVVAWQEFIDRYPESIFVPAAYIRMAEWYLTIKTTYGSPNWYKDEQKDDPNAIKDTPGLLDPVYAREAHKLLTKVIREYKDFPHYSHVGNGQFEWNDKAVAVALYNRAMFFRGGCKQDLARLERDYPDSPLTRDARKHFAKTCFR